MEKRKKKRGIECASYHPYKYSFVIICFIKSITSHFVVSFLYANFSCRFAVVALFKFNFYLTYLY